MAFKIVWTDRARLDRKEILTYWNNRNKSNRYSRKLNLLFNNSIERLQDFPLIGKAIGYKDTRYLIVRDYLIFYKIAPPNIVVVNIWDGRRNPAMLNKLLDT